MAPETMMTEPNPATPERPPMVPGATIGSYEILARLGRGGMGEVYHARHTRIGRQVALKVLKDDLPRREEASRRFLEEARAVNDIGHPNIIQIHDFVELDEPGPNRTVFLVMELLEGQDLAAYVDERGPLPLEETVAIANQVADALTAVHARGLLHRDLKPGNIFLTPQPKGPPRVTVLDFGAAKTIDPSVARDELTQPGMALGTPWYMAPEQVMDGTLDGRTDVYALGVVLYRMLTATVPFEDAAVSKLMVQIVRTRPNRASNLREEIPPALDALVLRCLEKRPDHRFADMAALQRALSMCLDGGPPPDCEAPTRQDPTLSGAGADAEEPVTSALPAEALPGPNWRPLLAIVAALLLFAISAALLWPTEETAEAVARGADAAVDAVGAAADVQTTADAPGDAGRTALDAEAVVTPKTVKRSTRRRRRPRRRRRRAKRPTKAPTKTPAAKRPANLKIVDPFDK